MQWSPGDRGNIEDARGRSGGRAVPVGIGAVIVLGLLSWATGTDFLSLLNQDPGRARAGRRVRSRPHRRKSGWSTSSMPSPTTCRTFGAGAGRPLPADAHRAVSRRGRVGLRLGGVGDRSVLLPGRSQGVSRSGVLRRVDAAIRRPRRFRRSLRDRARARPSCSALLGLDEGARAARPRAPTARPSHSSSRLIASPACGVMRRRKAAASRRDTWSWSRAMPMKRCARPRRSATIACRRCRPDA